MSPCRAPHRTPPARPRAPSPSSPAAAPGRTSRRPVQRAAAAPPALVVDLSASQFSPATVRAGVGEQITFVNRDAVAHTATATAGARFDSGAMEQGARFSFTPRETGRGLDSSA